MSGSASMNEAVSLQTSSRLKHICQLIFSRLFLYKYIEMYNVSSHLTGISAALCWAAPPAWVLIATREPFVAVLSFIW